MSIIFIGSSNRQESSGIGNTLGFTTLPCHMEITLLQDPPGIITNRIVR